MRFIIVTYYMLNIHGIKLGLDPVVLKFYSPVTFNHLGMSFSRMLLEYGRSIGRSGSQVEIISVEEG